MHHSRNMRWVSRGTHVVEPITYDLSHVSKTLHNNYIIIMQWVMLHIIHLSFFYPPKINVALKITIWSKFNNDLS
jgi:hypothetical protein